MNDYEIPFPNDPFPMRSVQSAEMLENTTSKTEMGNNGESMDHWNSMNMKTKAPKQHRNPRITSRLASMITNTDNKENNDIETERNDKDPFFDRV